MSNDYSTGGGAGGDGYRDNGYADDSSGYKGNYRGGYRNRGRSGYRGRGNDRGGYYNRDNRGGYLSRYNSYYGSSSRGRGGYSSYYARDSYRGDKYDTSMGGPQTDDSSFHDSYQEGYDDYSGNYGSHSDAGAYGYGLSLYRGGYRGNYRGSYSSRGGYQGKTHHESENPQASHLGWKEHTSSPVAKPKTPQHKASHQTTTSINPWVTILQIKDDPTKRAFEDTHRDLSRVDKELQELQHSKLKLENAVGSLERQAQREELHVQITNEKLEEFTYL